MSAASAVALAAARTSLEGGLQAAQMAVAKNPNDNSAQQAAMIYSAQERAQAEKDVCVGFRIMCGAPPTSLASRTAGSWLCPFRCPLHSRLLNLTH